MYWRTSLFALIKEQKSSLTFDKVKKKYSKFPLEELHAYTPEDELPTMPTYYALQKVFGKKEWQQSYAKDLEKQQVCWGTIYNATDMASLLQQARQE